MAEDYTRNRENSSWSRLLQPLDYTAVFVDRQRITGLGRGRDDAGGEAHRDVIRAGPRGADQQVVLVLRAQARAGFDCARDDPVGEGARDDADDTALLVVLAAGAEHANPQPR